MKCLRSTAKKVSLTNHSRAYLTSPLCWPDVGRGQLTDSLCCYFETHSGRSLADLAISMSASDAWQAPLLCNCEASYHYPCSIKPVS